MSWKKLKKVYIVGLIFIIFIIFVFVGYKVYLPYFINTKYDSYIRRLESKFKVEIISARIKLKSTDTLIIPQIEIFKKNTKVFDLKNVVLKFNPYSLIKGKYQLKLFLIRELIIALNDDVLDNLQSSVQLSSLKNGIYSAKKFSIPNFFIERVEIKKIKGFLSFRGQSFSISGGKLVLTQAAKLIDEKRYHLSMKIREDNGNGFDLDMKFSPERISGLIKFLKPQSLKVKGRSFEVKAVEFSFPGTIGIKDIEIKPYLKANFIGIPVESSPVDFFKNIKNFQLKKIVLKNANIYIDQLLLKVLKGSEKKWSTDGGRLKTSGKKKQKKSLKTEVKKDSRLFYDFFTNLLHSFIESVQKIFLAIFKLPSSIPLEDIKIQKAKISFSKELVSRFHIFPYLDNFSLHIEKSGFTLTSSFTTSLSSILKNSIYLLIKKDKIKFEIDLKNILTYPFRKFLPSYIIFDEKTKITNFYFKGQFKNKKIKIENLSFTVSNFHVFNEDISSFPLKNLEVSVDASGKITNDTIDLKLLKITLNGIKFNFKLNISHINSCPDVKFSIELPKTKAQEIIDRLPAGLIPMIKNTKMMGSFSFLVDGSFNACDLDTLKYRFTPLFYNLHVLKMDSRVDFKLLDGQFVKVIKEKDKKIKKVFGKGTKDWVDIEYISPYLVKAVTTTEDASFFTHSGFSSYQIRRAFIVNLKKLAFVKGASTITQQLVRNIYLTRKKTIARKLQEIFITWQIEKKLSKDKILELYFNVIEFGPGIYGIKPAAIHYFCKLPRDLNLLESVFLVSILPNPKKYHKFYEKGRISSKFRNYLKFILRTMVKRGKITEEEMKYYEPYDVKFVKEEDCPLIQEEKNQIKIKTF